jgi:hypothetical protein
MSKRRRLIQVGVSLAVIALCVGTLQLASALASAAPVGFSQDQFRQVRDLVEQDASDFGGISVDSASHAFYVYRVSSRIQASKTLAILQKARDLATSNDGRPKLWRMSVVDIAHSLAELRRTQDQILTWQPWATDSGAYLSTWFVDPAINAVEVNVTQITPRLTVDAQVFGSLVRLGVEPRPSTTASRSNDYPPPWFGGSVISGCTSGFGVVRKSNGHVGMLTAGHCFSLNSTVYQGSNLMGTVTWRVYGGSSYDSEFIDASGAALPDVYTGCLTCGTYFGVINSGPDGVGEAVCTDGSVNLENCSVGITTVDLCLRYSDGQTVCHLDAAVSTNGHWAVQKGDSGGPVYFHSGSGVMAVGTISGESGTGQGSNTVFFTPIQRDLQATFRMVCTAQTCN